MIPDEVKNEVLERADIVQVVGRQVDLRKAGTIYKGLCPFHDEKTPSFTVSPVRGTYHCFGCQAHGDAIRFVMEHDKLSFPEALRQLAGELGVEVPERRRESPAEKAERQRKKTLAERLFALQDKLTAYYSNALFHAPSAGVAQDYLRGRDITEEAAGVFRLGWADGDKRRFQAWVEQVGASLDDLALLGVLVKPETGWNRGAPLGGGYLRFRRRLMFPVVDLKGEVTGFSGRILDAEAKAAKYINSPETPLFTKGEQLYGAHPARNAARKAGRVVLCEGNVDVVMLWQAGFKGTVAPMGTALTPKQVRLVKRLADRVVCVMDGDAAGQKAAFASLIPFLEAGVQPRAVMLPAKEDPDSYVRAHGAEQFKTLLDGARPLLELYIEKQSDGVDDDIGKQREALGELAPVLVAIDDPLSFKLYRKRAAVALGLDEAFLDDAMAEARREASRREARRSARTGSRARPQRAEPRPPRAEAGPPAIPDFDPTAFQPPGEPPPAFFEQGPPPEPPPMWPGDETPPGDFTVEDAPDETLLGAPASKSIAASRFEVEILEFTLFYPDLAQQLVAEEAHKSLTDPRLADFVACLFGELGAGRTPNVDHLLAEQSDADLVTFVQGVRWRPPTIDESNKDEAIKNAIGELRHKALIRTRNELNEQLRRLSPDQKSERTEMLMELGRVLAAIQDLSKAHTEGAR